MARGQLIFESPEEKKESEESSPEDEVNEAAAALGLKLDAAVPLELDEKFALWPECQETFEIWMSVQTQWHVVPLGGSTGLNYAGVEACMRMLGIRGKKQVEIFSGVRLMEKATLAEWAKKR